MMKEKSYLIPVKPIAWKRAGISGSKFYDQQVADKINYGLYLNRCHGSAPLFTGPIELDVTFYMWIPKKGREADTYHHTTPDLDNLVKLLLDAIVDTKAIVSDDRIISVICAKKIYGKNPRTEFTIRELE
jgi:Holliday junction resolvase RusA-like endonuclease